MFDRGVEPNTENTIVARELPAINDPTLQAKSRWGGNEHHFARLPELLRNHPDPKSADIFRGNDFKNSRLVKAGDPQKLVYSGARFRSWNPSELNAWRHRDGIGRFLADAMGRESRNHRGRTVGVR